MTSRPSQAIAPISTTGAYVALVVSLLLLAAALLRGAQAGLAGMALNGVMACVVCVPLWLLAGLLGRRFVLDGDGVLSKGLLFGSQRMARKDLQCLNMRKGLGSFRGLRLLAGRREIALSTMNPGFWQAAHQLRSWAQADGFEVHWPLGCDEGAWWSAEPRQGQNPSA